MRQTFYSTIYFLSLHLFLSVEEEPDEDNMEEIDTDNIITDGRRTRGKAIDFAKAAEELPEDEDGDDEDDDDFEEKDEDAMQE